MDEAVFRAAVRRIFREQGFTAESLAQPKIRALVQATADIYMGAIAPALESGVMPEVMAQHLREDVFVFSGFKTYRELREAADLLRDKNGLLKSFDRFYNDVAAINEKYNRHWLKAEYIFAQASSEMAAKWVDFEKDGDTYDLQYRTANDDRVRYEHRVLHRVTLPTSDPFWEEFFPPNGWNCFVAGTPVLTAKGWVPIELIKKGDLVIGGSGKLRNVIGVHSKTVDDEVVSFFCKGFVTTSTKNHRFCTPSGWVQAEFLKPGDIVIKPGINTPFHLLVNAINNMIVILRYAFVSLERKRKTVSALAIDHKLKAWYKEIHDIFADKFTAFKWKAFICQIVRYYSFRFAKGSTDCTHTLRMNQSGKLGMFDRLGSYFRSKKRGTFLKLLSYIADKLAVFFSFSLSYMKPFGSKFMIHSGKPLSGILPASDIINPLSFHSLAAMSRCDIARHENTSDGSVVDLSMRTQPPITAKLGNIPEFNGINNIHAFDGFNSFFDFLCKTFFHNRYVMIEHKVISKKGKKEVYNLSVDVDESYIVPIGIAHNCRCTAVQVRKGKYPRSDSNTAIQQGREATYQAGKNGVNKAAIFRYNPGKQQVIFPPHHPYYPESCAQCPFHRVSGKKRLSLQGDAERKDCYNCLYLKGCITGEKKVKKQREEQRKAIDHIKSFKKLIDPFNGLKIESGNFISGVLTLLRRSLNDVYEHNKEDVGLMKWLQTFDLNSIQGWHYEGWSENRPYDTSHPKYDPNNPDKRKHPETDYFVYYSLKIGSEIYWANVKVHKLYGEVLYTIENNKPSGIIQGVKKEKDSGMR